MDDGLVVRKTLSRNFQSFSTEIILANTWRNVSFDISGDPTSTLMFSSETKFAMSV